MVEVLAPDSGEPVRFDIVQGANPASCSGAAPEPFTDGATDPSWSPVDYADLPDDPAADDPELTDPVPLSGTLAYIKDHQIWLSEPDGSAARQLTAEGLWGSPSLAADGTILASYGDDPESTPTALVRLSPAGELLSAFVPETLLRAGILSAEISPDGRTAEALGEAVQESNATWHPDGGTVITGYGNILRIGDEGAESWFIPNSFNSGDPSVSADGSALALAGSVGITLASMSGPPPAEAHEYGSCERAYDAETQSIHQAALSPDFGDATTMLQAGRQAAHVVLARVDVFADALGGSVLTAAAPLLFTGRDALDPATAAEIDRVLGGAGTVYLLGDTQALAEPVEQTLMAAGYTPRRLAGPSRVETAVAVADEAARLYGAPGIVVIARADSPPENPTAAWADSISAGAWAAETGQPILLTQTTLSHPAVAAWLQGHSGEVVFLGSTAAIDDQAAAGLASPVVRAAGSNRYSTAVVIADQLWTSTASGYAVGNGAAPDAWTYDLAAAGLAADLDQPLLLTEADRLPDETAAALGCPRPAVTVIGTPTLITSDVRTQITSC